MKKYRVLLPIVMVILMVSSWYLLVSDSTQAEEEYNYYLDLARGYAEDGITKYAIENYELVLEKKSSPEMYVEIINYFITQDNASEYVSWSKCFFELYPTEPRAYDCLLDAYYKDGAYENCFDILETAEKRNVTSEYIEKVREESRYLFKLDYNTYVDVGIYSNNFCPIFSKDAWGFVDRYGKQHISCKYNQVGAYTQSKFVSVVNTDGDAYFIDKTGAKVLVSKEKYKSFGLLVNGIIAAEREDGKYVYVNQDFENLFGEYDYASTMNNGIAAVLTNEKWILIDANGKEITKNKYVDVKLDEKEIAYRNGRIFVAIDNEKYIMIDETEKQIGTHEFENARVFASEGPTAVEINGKWRFIDVEGNLISDKTYDEARSFNNELAAVCINGKWGFVDLEENVVIEPQFFNARDFNEKGSCFVMTGDKWQLLKIYRLNRF